MTKQETQKIMAVLVIAYPSFYRGTTDKDLNAAVNLWTEMFADDSYTEVSRAVKALIATKKDTWPPNIGQVKEKLAMLKSPEKLSANEAWALISKAIRNSIYDSAKEFAALPKEVQRLVGSPNQLRDWAMMDLETVQSVIASNFMKGYSTQQIRDSKIKMLPQSMKEIVGALADGLSIRETNE